MKKRYLKNIEDIEALRNTDTKIYSEGCGGYYKFINGVLCYLSCDGEDFQYQVGLWLSQEPYIEVEDELSEDYIGKLVLLWDVDENHSCVDILEQIDDGMAVGRADGYYYEHFRPLTPEEVEKYTGYKVVKED